MPGFDQLTQPPGIGRVLAGRYRLVAPIARGGMAEVWEGHDEVLSRPVAVKVLQAHLAADGVFLERFRREAVTAARLGHPGITATFDTGLDQGTAFIVMELVRGRNLRQVLADQGRLEPWQAAAIARQVADALGYAHQAGLVHRDVKPANILLVEDELGSIRVKVTDFGIAKAGIQSGADLTRTGMVLGTPKYLSPEQIRGVDPDPRADLYSLGVVLYEMLVGAPPYARENDMATALAHLNERVPRPGASVRGIPGPLDRVVTDLLAKNPDRRIQSGAELRRRLDDLGPLGPPRHEQKRAGRRRHDLTEAAEGAAALAPQRPAPASTGNRFSAVPPPPPVPAQAPGPEPTAALPQPDATRADGPLGASPTTAMRPAGPPPEGPVTDRLGARPGGERRFRRSERAAGFVVLGLVVAGAVVAGTLLGTRSHHSGAGSPVAGSPAAKVVKVVGATVFMDNDHDPDHPDAARNVFDGNPATYWQTDHYHTPTFSGLYSGVGLELQLAAPASLHHLTVDSPTPGWAASVYVSATAVPSGQALSAWGKATDAKSGIDGNATFSLGGRKGSYVLLWITNLGPDLTARIGEVSVS